MSADWEDVKEEEPYHMTLGDLRQLIAEGQFDMINPEENSGNCFNCDAFLTLSDVTASEYDNDTFVESASEILCEQCRSEGV